MASNKTQAKPQLMKPDAADSTESAQSNAEQVRACNYGLYDASIQYLAIDGQWYGWGSVSFGNCSVIDWWSGIRFKAVCKRWGFGPDKVIVDNLYLAPGETLELGGNVVNPSYRIIRQQGNKLVAVTAPKTGSKTGKATTAKKPAQATKATAVKKSPKTKK